MTVELRPMGVACNLECHYCYQNPQREAGNLRQSYDLEKMKAAVEREGGPFTLFGGEPLLIPSNDLEELLRWGLEKYGKNSIQTNGALINDEHIRLFKQYNVDVGISIDGPGELNDLRWIANEQKTRDATAKVEAAIERVCLEWNPPGLIATLHRLNAVPEKLPAMKAWIKKLDALGVRSLRLHLLESENEYIRKNYALSDRENVEAILYFAEFQNELKNIQFDVIREMESLLVAKDQGTSCVWHACDPYATEAVRGVEGNGQSSNCGRTNKDGIDFTKADESGFERYLALYHTPQEDGGCQGCRFFMACKGQCPGTAIDGDWRNRTEHCEIWKTLFSQLERNLVQRGEWPLSIHPVRKRMEAQLLQAWSAGRNISLSNLSWAPVENDFRSTSATVAPGNDDKFSAQPAQPNDFRLPHFARLAWTADSSREIWEPRFKKINEWSLQSGIYFVADGMADCAVRQVSPSRVFEYLRLASQKGLSVEPWGKGFFYDSINGNGNSSTASGKYQKVVVGKSDDLKKTIELRRMGDHEKIGSMLGIPECCRDFYLQKALPQNLKEPVWLIPEQGEGDFKNPLEWRGDPGLNIFLKAIGIQAVFHFPCSPGCSASTQIADRTIELAKESGFEEVADWLREILSWPLEWSANHGIAEIKIPIAKISSRADATAGKIVVQYAGSASPEESARGLGYPYNMAGKI